MNCFLLSIASKGIHKGEDEVLKSQCKQMAKMELLGNKLVEDGITGAFSLCKRILLIIAGEEQNPGPITTFQTKLDKCLICKSGEIVITKRSVEKENNFIIYGRNGEREGTHLEGRCNFKNGNFTCNAGYFYGYMTYKGFTIWHVDALKKEILVTSDQTGFDIDYLVELAGDIAISSTTFEAAAKKYNRFHNPSLPFDVLNKRVIINEKRICNAIKLYAYLEAGQRHHIHEY